jgi:hypothetical protein
VGVGSGRFSGVEAVEDPVGDRGEEDACGDDDDEAAVEGVAACEELACGGERRVYRAHAAEEHGGVEEGVGPVEVFEVVVSEHADGEGGGDEECGDAAAAGHAGDEVLDWEERLSVVFEGGEETVHGVGEVRADGIWRVIG